MNTEIAIIDTKYGPVEFKDEETWSFKYNWIWNREGEVIGSYTPLRPEMLQQTS